MGIFQIAMFSFLVPIGGMLYFGQKAVRERNGWKLFLTTAICIVVQIVLTFSFANWIANDAMKENVRCGMPQASMVVFGLFGFFVIGFTFLVQMIVLYFRKRAFDRDLR